MDDISGRSEPNAATTRHRGRSAGDPHVGWTAIVSGLLILGFVAQQLFVTTWFAEQQQDALAEEAQEHFATTKVAEVEYVRPASQTTIEDGTVVDPPTETARSRMDPSRDAPGGGAAPEGAAFAIVRVPSIDRLKDGWTVVEGVGVANLQNGAGHMPFTPLPGQPGNAVISGHRTTYGAPFHELDTLEPGDLIEVETAIGVHTYAVSETVIVSPPDLWVTDPRDGAWLTLTTCHPKFSSRQRLVVFA